MDMARVRVVCSGWQGAPGLNTFYFGWDGTPGTWTSEIVQDCVDRVTAFFTSARGIFPEAWSMATTSAVDIVDAATGDITAVVSSTAGSIASGTSTPGFGPAASGLCLNLLTGVYIGGRQLRGRSFFSPIGLQDDGNGSPTTTQINTLEGAAVGLETVDGSGVVGVVWHRPVSGAGGVAHPIIAASVSDRFSVLRSRRG